MPTERRLSAHTCRHPYCVKATAHAWSTTRKWPTYMVNDHKCSTHTNILAMTLVLNVLPNSNTQESTYSFHFIRAREASLTLICGVRLRRYRTFLGSQKPMDVLVMVHSLLVVEVKGRSELCSEQCGLRHRPRKDLPRSVAVLPRCPSRGNHNRVEE